mgnify:CR=1 FL=1
MAWGGARVQRNHTVCVMTPERKESSPAGACPPATIDFPRRTAVVLTPRGGAWHATGPACDRTKIDLPEVTISKSAIQSLEAQLDVSPSPSSPLPPSSRVASNPP